MTQSTRVFLRCLLCVACVVEVVLFFSYRVPYANAALDGTRVAGDIAADTTWDAARGPYILDGDVHILPGVRFTITDGTRITSQGDVPGRLVATGATVHIEGARFDGGTTLYTTDSDVFMASTTVFAGAGDAVHMDGGHLDARRLRLERNSGAGIYVTDSVKMTAQINVHDSVFKENGAAFTNKAFMPVEVQNNWWGQPNGPIFSGLNRLVGRAGYSPWLSAEPGRICCSSILFIPGLEGTRLYDGSEKLWEPLTNADVRRLFLTPAGTSVGTITAGEVIGSAYGLKGVYGNFFKFLDALVASGTVAEARPFGYDWRKPVEEVAGPALTGLVQSMAARSKTGKVIVIAHSGGGLVAKSLVRSLSLSGRSEIIDRVIAVGVPYTGTPESLLALLHGDRQEILGGLVLSAETARSLARNMPSAYALLPSAASSSSTESTLPLTGIPSSTAFVSGKLTVRGMSALWNFLTGKLNATLLAAAVATHGLLDPFVWPREVMHTALVGWNVLTTTGIHYFDRLDCRLTFLGRLGRLCKVAEAHTIDMSPQGDGTIIAPSASYAATETASLDLDKISRTSGTDIDHANIMESETTQNIISHIVRDGPLAALSLDGFLLSAQPPDLSSAPRYVRFTVNGTADLAVYSDGPNGAAATATQASPAALGRTRRFHDDAGTTTTVIIPVSSTGASGGHYSVALTGTGIGYASLTAQKLDANGQASGPAVSYEPALVLPGSTASTTVDDALTTTPPLSVDLDSNGTPDESVPATSTAATGTDGVFPNATSTVAATGDLSTTTVDVLRGILCK